MYEAGDEEALAYDIGAEQDNENSSQRRGFGLDLSKASKGRKDDASIQETCVTVVFELPDGSQAEQTFKLGYTVEVLKAYVESEFGIPMMDQELYLDDTPMMNPLSLLDFPGASDAEELFIRVEGALPQSAKK